MFLTNCWYAAACGDELSHELLERKVCGEKLVLLRTSAREALKGG